MPVWCGQLARAQPVNECEGVSGPQHKELTISATFCCAGRATAGPVGAPYRPGAAAAPPPAAYRQVGYAPTSSATGAAASAAGPYAAGRTGAAGPGAAGGYGAQSAAATRDPSVAAAAGSGGGDAEALHALISSALLLQDEALIAGNNQVGNVGGDACARPGGSTLT